MRQVFIRNVYDRAHRELLKRLFAEYRTLCRKARIADYQRWAVYTVID